MGGKGFRFWMVALLVTPMACRDVGPGKNIDFNVLRSADRIEVRTADDRIVATITSQMTIDKVQSFIERHHDGWREPWYGPDLPRVMLYFFNDDRKLGGFGLDRQTLVVEPTMSSGWLSRDVSKVEVDALLNDLELTWPK